MDKRVIAGMGVAAMVFALALVLFTRPSTEPVAPTALARPVAAAQPSEQNRHAPAAPADPGRPMVMERAQPLTGEVHTPGRPQGTPNYEALGAGRPPGDERDEARREYRCRTLQEQADLMDRLIVIGGGRTLDPDRRLEMASRVATLGTRVFEEDENIRAGRLDCGDGGVTDMGSASDFLVRTRDELGGLLDAQGTEELEQAISLFDGAAAP